jgi:hypothetical protein
MRTTLDLPDTLVNEAISITDDKQNWAEFFKIKKRGCSKTSVFGTATLDLSGKAGFRPLFRKPVPKPTEFWNRLKILIIISKWCKL